MSTLRYSTIIAFLLASYKVVRLLVTLYNPIYIIRHEYYICIDATILILC